MASRHPLSSDCTGLWRLNETGATDDAIDSSGNGNTGVILGSVASAAGQFGTSRGPYTYTDRFEVAYDATLESDHVTIAAWFKLNAGEQNNFAMILDRAGALHLPHMALGITDGVGYTPRLMGWIAFSDGTGNNILRTIALPTLEWVHAGLTWDGSYFRMYVNGEMYSELDRSGKTIGWDQQELFIGADEWQGARYFQGVIDEVAQYNTAKPASWFAQMWTEFAVASLPRVIGTRGSVNKIYQLVGTYWEEFPVQPGTTLADGIWGGPNNTIWAHNNQGGASARYLFFDGASWSQYAIPAQAYVPATIHGSNDGLHVYAACKHEIHKWDGAAWSVLKDIYPDRSFWRARSIWCDSTGQHVWTAGGHDVGIIAQVHYSSDYGATWNNVWAAALSDLGLASAYNACANGVWGLSATEVYINWGWNYDGVPPALPGAAGGISRWNGSSWSWVSQGAGLEFFALQDGSVWADGNGLYVCNGGWASEDIHIDVGGTLTRKVEVTSQDPPVGRNVIGIPGEVAVVALDGRFGTTANQYISRDDGATWQGTLSPWAGSELGLGSIAVYGTVFQTPPYLKNQDPAPLSTGNPSDTQFYLEVVDDDGDLDISTVDIYLDGDIAWTGDAPVQPGHSAIKIPVTDGYGYTIAPWESHDPGSHTIRVVAEDSLANALDDSYVFSTDAASGICDRLQWGDFQWGDAEWAQCSDFTVTAVPINEYTIRVYFGVVVQQDDALTPSNYTITGGFRQLSVLSVSMVNSTTVDLTVEEMTDGAAYTVGFLFTPFESEIAAFTGLGVHPFVSSIVNQAQQVLEVTFSEQMLIDTALGRPSSYQVTPQGDAKLLYISGVVVDADDTTRVVLAFSGGGSSYILSTPGLMDPAGNYCSPSDFLFEISNPEIDELLSPERLFLDTDMGVMSLGISELSRRRVEDLAILRARNEGHLRQFSLIADELERSGIDRDDRKLKLFKG